jgi:hypothetical protein
MGKRNGKSYGVTCYVRHAQAGNRVIRRQVSPPIISRMGLRR